VNNKFNQVKNHKINQNPKTDGEKLAGLEKFIHKIMPYWSVIVEPFILFTKGEDEFVSWETFLTQSMVEKYLIHPPDLLLIDNGKMIILELDGKIHDIKTEKTDKRNKRCELNNIPYIVVNEADLRVKLDIPKTRPLTQDQINNAFHAQLIKLL